MGRKKKATTTYGLFYGTLRKGESNFQRINKMFPGSLKFVTSMKLRGYRMYDLTYYPVCIYTGEKNIKVVADVMEVTTDAAEYIKQMELSAGYTQFFERIRFKDPLTKYEVTTRASIYLMPHDMLIVAERVGEEIFNGDWVDYQKKLTE